LGAKLVISEPLLQAAGLDPAAFDLVPLDLRNVQDPLPSLSITRMRNLAPVLVQAGVLWIKKSGGLTRT